MTKDQLIHTIANMKPYTWAEDESWSDDQAEDAIVSLNDLIREARKVIKDERNV